MKNSDGGSGEHNAGEEFVHQFEAARAQFEVVSERIEKRAGRNLFLAVSTGLVIGGVFLASLLFFKWAFIWIAGVASIAAAIELSTALRIVHIFVPRVGVAVGVGVITVAALFGDVPGLVAGTGGAIIIVVVWYAIERWIRVSRSGVSISRSVVRDLLALFGVIVYTGSLIAFSVLLFSEPRGEWWVLGFIIVVVANDTGAYVAGVAWGKHPMAPVISPKKSWEGFAGGVVSACVAGVLISWLMLPESLLFGVLFGLCLAISGTLGDLLESYIKRRIGIKDMSSWLPGHGGVLDRLDSLALSAPMAYVLFLVASLWK